MTTENRVLFAVRTAQPWTARTPRVSRRISRCAVATLVAILGVGCFGRSPEPEDPALSDPNLRAARIDELRQAIKRDHETLEDLITRPGAEWNTTLHEDPEMRAIAARLTEQEEALERLETAADAAEAARLNGARD
jgi:hypothetical protein